MSCPFDYKPRWERRKDARPQELLAAALDLFVEKGFASTRLEDVAKRAGVSKGTLYLYFENKDELFKAVVRENIVPAIGDAEDIIAGFEGNSAELLRCVMLGWWERIGETKASGITKLMMSEANNFPELTAFYNEEVISRCTAMIAGMLEAAIAKGEFRPMNVMALTQVLIAPVLTLMMWKHVSGPCGDAAQTPQVFLETLIDMALYGVVVQGPEGKSAISGVHAP
jgi:AcrR family transcriptional regulator